MFTNRQLVRQFGTKQADYVHKPKLLLNQEIQFKELKRYQMKQAGVAYVAGYATLCVAV